MSTHRSPNRTKHRAPQRRALRKRTKTIVIGAVAVGLTGAAYSAHANFGRAHLGSGNTVASDGVTTASAQTLSARAEKAPANRAPWWPPRTTWWPQPTTATPTKPTPRPTTTSPTSRPTTTSPTTTRPTTTKPTTTTPTTTTPTTSSPPGPVTGGKFPGLIPGQFYLGMSCGTVCPSQEAKLSRDYGLHRTYKSWGNWNGVAKEIQADHGAGRLPWVSIKGPGSGPSGWQALANGSYDDQIRQLAEVLKANDGQPVFVTFHHEPSNDGTDADGAKWAAAYVRFHDVLKNAGALANVADPPILGDWLFNPRNSQNPDKWLTAEVMNRMPFLGVDMYQNSSGETYADRIPRIIDWMKQRGYNKMVGIGETGSTDYYGGTTAVKWMNDSLGWAAANADQLVAVSYFNSTANSRAGVYWPLDETAAKLTAYRNWLGNAKSID